jgi:hypothetical protein
MAAVFAADDFAAGVSVPEASVTGASVTGAFIADTGAGAIVKPAVAWLTAG